MLCVKHPMLLLCPFTLEKNPSLPHKHRCVNTSHTLPHVSTHTPPSLPAHHHHTHLQQCRVLPLKLVVPPTPCWPLPSVVLVQAIA